MKYNNKNIGSQEILIPENLIEMSNFFIQLISQLKRNFLPIYRNKFMLLLEYLSGLGIIYIFFFLINQLLFEKDYIDLFHILEKNIIYIYQDNLTNGALEDSYAYGSSKEINLNTLSKKPNSIKNLIDLAYDESNLHIAMGCISINQIGDKWNSFVTSIELINLLSYTLFVVSAFLKKEFGIDAIILNKITMKENEILKADKDITSIRTTYMGIIIGYIIFLGGLINEKIKERKTNVKHLLYLSGSNSWSYWLAFFIIDYLKLLVFSFLLLIPIYCVFGKPIIIIYLLGNLLFVNASSLIFIYFISLFGSHAKSGIKFLFILSISFVIFLIGINIIGSIIETYDFKNNFFIEPAFYTYFFHFTPITSFIFSLSCILYTKADMDSYQNDTKPLEDHLFTSSIIQVANLTFYFSLLILIECGYLKKFFNWFKLKFCLNKYSFVFSQEQLSEELSIYNNINNPLLLNQTIIQPNKYKEMYKKKNSIELSRSQNSNVNNMNTRIIPNNNQDIIKEKEYNIQNNISIDSLNQSLIQDNNINDDNIVYSINKVSLPETNLAFDIRKSNSDTNKEKLMLDARNDFTTRIEGLYKIFWFCCRKNVRAINNLNLGLEANEKFGLLGFNGSGKTTTFRAITNEILYDYGRISIFGFDIRKQFKNIRPRIGYCPQENPLFDFMKVREILEFYSNLKTCYIPIEEICKRFGLTKYLDTYCVNLSGGNKRKLTFAIAIMNRPTLLLLDEPSTGVDPDSRRFMWKNINELSNSGHRYNMILTTHSMEEAEILCDRVGWLKHGSFVCIGNPEKLKIQYSLGYKLHIKFDEQLINKDNLVNNIGEVFKTISGLIDGFNNYSNLIMNNPNLEPHIIALIDVIKKIKSNTKSIILAEIRKDLSFELILNIIQERKHILFSDILNIKNNDKNISEIIISMESLENILSSFK